MPSTSDGSAPLLRSVPNEWYRTSKGLFTRNENLTRRRYIHRQWRIQDFPRGGGVNPPGGA